MNFRLLIFSLFTLIFIQCDPSKKLSTDSANFVHKEPIEFIILQMNDVYEIAPLEGGKAGGLARVATVRKELMKENPNTITVLAGDFLSPSFVGTLTLKEENGKKEKIAGLQMVETLNALGLDYVTLGNHEFDLRDPELLELRMSQSNFKYTICNANMIENGKHRPFRQMVNNVKKDVPKYIIREITSPTGDKLRIGFLGVVLPFVKQDYLHYDPINSSFKKTYDELKTISDVQIGITHLNLDQDIALAKEVEGVALYTGGHEHHELTRYVNSTVIAKADANAKTVYIHRIKVDPHNGMTKINSEVKVIDETIPDDPGTKMVVDKWVNKAYKLMKEMGYNPDQVVLKISEPLDCRESSIRSSQTNFGKLTMKAIEAAVPGANVYLLNSGSMRLDDQLHNIVTEYDVLRTYPYGGKLVNMKIPGNVLLDILRIGATTNQGEGGYLQVRHAEGLKINPGMTYDVVLPKYLAEGNESNLEVFEKYEIITPKKEFTVGGNKVRNDLRDVVIAYMKGM